MRCPQLTGVGTNLGLSGKLKMNAMTVPPRRIGMVNGKRQEAGPAIYEHPNSSHKHRIKPREQKIPKLETCSPRLFAFAVSACHTDTVAMMPPVPKPRMSLETMS